MPRKPKPRRPGRPSLCDAARSVTVTIKLTPAEREQWAALAGDQPLSEWIRQRCSQ